MRVGRILMTRMGRRDAVDHWSAHDSLTTGRKVGAGTAQLAPTSNLFLSPRLFSPFSAPRSRRALHLGFPIPIPSNDLHGGDHLASAVCRDSSPAAGGPSNDPTTCSGDLVTPFLSNAENQHSIQGSAPKQQKTYNATLPSSQLTLLKSSTISLEFLAPPLSNKSYGLRHRSPLIRYG